MLVENSEEYILEIDTFYTHHGERKKPSVSTYISTYIFPVSVFFRLSLIEVKPFQKQIVLNFRNEHVPGKQSVSGADSKINVLL